MVMMPSVLLVVFSIQILVCWLVAHSPWVLLPRAMLTRVCAFCLFVVHCASALYVVVVVVVVNVVFVVVV